MHTDTVARFLSSRWIKHGEDLHRMQGGEDCTAAVVAGDADLVQLGGTGMYTSFVEDKIVRASPIFLPSPLVCPHPLPPDNALMPEAPSTRNATRDGIRVACTDPSCTTQIPSIPPLPIGTHDRTQCSWKASTNFTWYFTAHFIMINSTWQSLPEALVKLLQAINLRKPC